MPNNHVENHSEGVKSDEVPAATQQEDTGADFASKPEPGGRWRWAVILGLALVVLAGLSAWWIHRYIYAPRFTPTQLDQREREILNKKLQKFEKAVQGTTPRSDAAKKDDSLRSEPEAYTEAGADRTIHFTEKEINALIANQPEIAQRLAIDLSDDLISIKVLMPMDKDILFLGGKTLRLHAGLSVRFENGKPEVALQGISLGGIPLPNAWLGNLKYKNLVKEFGSQEGFWKLFDEGVADIKISQGEIQIRLKE